MKTIITKTAILATLALIITAGSGCQKDDMRIYKHDPSLETSSLTNKPGPVISNYTGKIAVRLKDIGTAGFGAIDLTINGVALHYLDERVGKGGWVYLPYKPRLADMLLYQDGPGLLMGSSITLPLGVIDEVQVLFGDPNYVVWGDVSGRHKADLLLSKSGHMVDVKLHLPVDLRRAMIVTLGFNANESISHQADGTYFLRPNIILQSIRYVDLQPSPTDLME